MGDDANRSVTQGASRPASGEAVLVLGMHRSGTSALAGVLACLGAGLPRTLMKENAWNPRGHWESEALMHFHNRLLAAARSRWDDWHAFDPDRIDSTQYEAFTDKLLELVDDEFGDRGLFVVKDPRICRFVPFWLNALERRGLSPKIVIPLRNPLEVARSLEKRDAIPFEKALLLWLRHCLEAEAATRHLPRSFQRYDALLRDWRGVVSGVARDLGLQWPTPEERAAAEIDSFLTLDLHHNQQAEHDGLLGKQVAEWIVEAYECLLALTLAEGEDDEYLKCLDRVRNAFDRAAPFLDAVFAQPGAEAMSLAVDVKSLRWAQDCREEPVGRPDAVRADAVPMDAVHYVNAGKKELENGVCRSARLDERLREEERYLAEKVIHGLSRKVARLKGRLSDLSSALSEADARIRGMEQKFIAQKAVNDEATRKAEHLQSELAAQAQRTAFMEQEVARLAKGYRRLDTGLIRFVSRLARDGRKLNGIVRHVASPDYLLPGRRRVQRRKTKRDREASSILEANLFDAAWYVQQHMDVAAAGTDPLIHYLSTGGREGRDPNPFFDIDWYVREYPDVLASGMDPLMHYLVYGAREGRDPGPLFSTEWYLTQNPDVAESGLNPLGHYLAFGIAEGRLPCRPAGTDGATSRSRGTILLVSHDAELGGAQQVVRVFGQWLAASTYYRVKFVTMRGGAFAQTFREIADTFDIGACSADWSEDDIAAQLKEWAGPDVKAVFLNSVASGGFLNLWADDTPVVAYVHELENILGLYEENASLLAARADVVVAGSDAVRDALKKRGKIDEDRLRVVYGFIEEFSADRLFPGEGKKAAKEELGIPADCFLAVGCGVVHWRKSPVKFVEVAERVRRRHGPKARFVWIGGGPDQEACERLVREKGLEDVVRFTGYESDIMRYLNAADLFLLTSEEDPFPLVCLYAAMALAPVVCFEEAGGMPEFVARGCGSTVPFGDVGAMSEVVLGYIADEARREREGRCGRVLVRSDFTIATTGPQLLHHIREASGLTPRVSVVVPNFNYEKFLPERLDSIAGQTFQDFELILLDDRSSDGSVSILEKWVSRRPGTRLVVNETNSGSPFAQWMRGMELAQSDLVWIAEADDFASEDLLATLLPKFDDRNVFLGYVKSVPVNEEGAVQGDYEKLYLNRINEGRWSQSYIATDHIEANEGLGIANSIPNASSVVLRRFEPEPEFVSDVTGMKMCGDWLFYLRAMRGGLVAYDGSSLNFHRRHGSTVTSRTEGSERYFDELAQIRAYVSRNWHISEAAARKIERFTIQDLDRFGIVDDKRRDCLIAEARPRRGAKTLPTLLVVASDLSPGGGQLFAIRLANAWTRHGGRAVLLNVGQFPDHPQVVRRVDPRVVLLNAQDIETSLKDVVERFDIDVVHSSIWWADRYVHEHLDEIGELPWVVTLHGCYETHLENPDIDGSFPRRMRDMLSRVDCWVYTAEKNRRVFEKYGRPAHECEIFNGVDPDPVGELSRAEIGVREEALLVCLASRAIEEKGWLDAAAIVERLNASGRPFDLLLVGEGPAADKLRRIAPANVHLVGQVSNLQDYIAVSDIGILPSYFVGESMPLVLMDMMAQGKPIAATDVGEIANMLGTGEDAAGIVVPLADGRVDRQRFEEALRYLADDAIRAGYGRAARKRYEAHFTTDAMISNYAALYRRLSSHEEKEAQECD